ncbi:MAG: PilZ domain-containing protein, partial [Magnetococcales bacterium]|nr:PilZ domain-containing protein [Magnetococcales bacterium]
MTDNRSHSRVEVPIEVSLHCDNGSVYRGNIKDISMSGVKIKVTKIHDLGFCSSGILKMRCGSVENPCVAELHGALVRLEDDTMIYKLMGSDLDNFNQLKRAILEHAADPDKVIDEIKTNPDLSLNSLYMPAMQEAIRQFVIGAAQSIFGIYLDLDVQVLDESESHVPVDVSVSGISSFNGALYGSVVLVADLNFGQEIVAGL